LSTESDQKTGVVAEPHGTNGRNGAPLSGEPDVQFEFDERMARERKIARARLVWENRRFLGRVAAISFLSAVVIALLIPKSYESVARLMPPDSQAGSGLAMAAMALTGASSAPALGGLGGVAGQLLGLRSTSDLLVGVLSSRTVADKLIEKFNLRQLYGTHRMEDARRHLAEHTKTSVDRKTQIIEIAVSDKDPHRAQAMTETYVEELNRSLSEVSTSSARRERIFIEGRLQEVGRDLEQAEKQFGQFSSKNSTVDIKEQGKAMVEAAALLQGQLIAARSELEGIRRIYTDNNIRVQTLKARIAELENQLQKIGGKDVVNPSGEVDNDSGSLYPTIRKLPLLAVPYADLYRKSKVEEALFETLTQEYELAKVEEAREIPSVKTLDAPNLPDSKSFPPRTLIVMVGTALGLAGGVFWLFGKSRWEHMDPADPGKVMAQEVLHTIKAAMPWAERNGFKHAATSEARDSIPKTQGRNSGS